MFDIEEIPNCCYICGEYFSERDYSGGEVKEITIDTDDGNPECGPKPCIDIVEVHVSCHNTNWRHKVRWAK